VVPGHRRMHRIDLPHRRCSPSQNDDLPRLHTGIRSLTGRLHHSPRAANQTFAARQQRLEPFPGNFLHRRIGSPPNLLFLLPAGDRAGQYLPQLRQRAPQIEHHHLRLHPPLHALELRASSPLRVAVQRVRVLLETVHQQGRPLLLQRTKPAPANTQRHRIRLGNTVSQRLV